MTSHKFTDVNTLRKFIFSGYAIFTMKSESGKHATYLVTVPKKNKHNLNQEVFWVNIFMGNDNTSSSPYSFVGLYLTQA